MKHEVVELGPLQIRFNVCLDAPSALVAFDLVRTTTWSMNYVRSLLIIYACLTNFNCVCFSLDFPTLADME